MTDLTAAPPALSKMTAYQLLLLVDFPDPKDGAITSGWMELGSPVVATSAAAAIRANAPLAGGKLVAIPARSWKPVKVTVEQTTVVKVGE
jgi:hypothetical protein